MITWDIPRAPCGPLDRTVRTALSRPLQGSGTDMLLGGLSFSIFFVLLVAAMTGFVIWRWKHPYQPAPYPAKRENGISFATTYYQPGGQGPPVGESVCNNGHHNDATAKFCRACGVALPRGSNGNKPPQLTCPGGHRSEGTRAPDGSVHCWC